MPQLIFLPGASGSAEYWTPVTDLMPADRDIRRLSWPGAGNEPHDPAIRGFDDLVGLTVAGISEPADLVAGAVVTRDVPAGVIAVGNPARVLREIDASDRLELPPG